MVGGIVAAFTPEQKAYLAKMKFGDFSTWPDVERDQYKLPRGTEKLVNVAYMTYASELFSWCAGSLEADTYFCPERHGTYFGGFYMKDMPAMGKRDYDISTSVTGDSGQEFLRTLTEEQRKHVTAIPDQQRQALREIVDTRRAISAELRKFLTGAQADKEKGALRLGRRYGELDGELSYYYATAFAKANKTLTAEQRRDACRSSGSSTVTPARRRTSTRTRFVMSQDCRIRISSSSRQSNLRRRDVTSTARTCVALICLLTARGGSGDAQEKKRGRGRQAGPPETFLTNIPAYEGNVILGRPTSHSVTLSVLMREGARIAVTYGRAGPSLQSRTAVFELTAGQPHGDRARRTGLRHGLRVPRDQRGDRKSASSQGRKRAFSHGPSTGFNVYVHRPSRFAPRP